MTDEDQDQAKAAIHLIREPVFEAAVREARQMALESLATIPPNDQLAITEAQANIRAVDLLTTALAHIIQRGTSQKKNPVA